jgi:hypothetical protein
MNCFWLARRQVALYAPTLGDKVITPGPHITRLSLESIKKQLKFSRNHQHHSPEI